MHSQNNLKQKRFARNNAYKHRNSPSRSENQISNFYIKASSLQHSTDSIKKLFTKMEFEQALLNDINAYQKPATIRIIDDHRRRNLELRHQISCIKKPKFFTNAVNQQPANNQSKIAEKNELLYKATKTNKRVKTHSAVNPEDSVQQNLTIKLLQATMKLQLLEQQNIQLRCQVKSYKIKLSQFEQNYTNIKQINQQQYEDCLLKKKSQSSLIYDRSYENIYAKRISQLEQQLQKIKKSSIIKIQILQEQLSSKQKQLQLNKQQAQKLFMQLDFAKRKILTMDLEKQNTKKQYSNLKKRFTQVLKQYTEIMKKVGKDQITKKIQNAKMKNVVFKLNEDPVEDTLEKLSISSGD